MASNHLKNRPKLSGQKNRSKPRFIAWKPEAAIIESFQQQKTSLLRNPNLNLPVSTGALLPRTLEIGKTLMNRIMEEGLLVLTHWKYKLYCHFVLCFVEAKVLPNDNRDSQCLLPLGTMTLLPGSILMLGKQTADSLFWFRLFTFFCFLGHHPCLKKPRST